MTLVIPILQQGGPVHPARYQWSSAATGQGWIVGWVQAVPVFPQRQHWAGDSGYAPLMTPVGVAGTVFIQLWNEVELPEPWASSPSTGAVTSLRAHCPRPLGSVCCSFWSPAQTFQKTPGMVGRQWRVIPLWSLTCPGQGEDHVLIPL